MSSGCINPINYFTIPFLYGPTNGWRTVNDVLVQHYTKETFIAAFKKFSENHHGSITMYAYFSTKEKYKFSENDYSDWGFSSKTTRQHYLELGRLVSFNDKKVTIDTGHDPKIKENINKIPADIMKNLRISVNYDTLPNKEICILSFLGCVDLTLNEEKENTKMNRMTRKIDTETMKEIQKAFYKKEAMFALYPQDTATPANKTIVDAYADASVDLAIKMDTMESKYLGSMYKMFPYTYDMLFAEDKVLLSIDDEDNALELAEKLKALDWELVK